ncbi:Allantoicase [Massospora cicadina]|nr:Allantoicase [Massospora cicadina]
METEIISVSDDFFACADNLINPAAPVAKPGTFTEKGAWYDGWESRRHNSRPYDYVIFKLKYPGSIRGINMDCTTFGVGNSFCFGELEGAYVENDEAEPKWEIVIPKVPIIPNSNNFFRLRHPTKIYNLLKLNGYPDGGLNRLRVYGIVRKSEPSALTKERIDLLFVGNGGMVSGCSNVHFSHPSNLLFPGRGENMGDGWETARSRAPQNSEWVILKFGAPGIVDEVIIDTKDFKGNFPQKVEIYAINTPMDKPHYHSDMKWTHIAGGKLRADALVKFPISENNSSQVFTHLKVQIFPDGGIKRVRALGYFITSATPASRPEPASEIVVTSAQKENEVQNTEKSNTPYNLRKRPTVDYSQPLRPRRRLSIEAGSNQHVAVKVEPSSAKRVR